jgi:ankyrin repeat protein
MNKETPLFAAVRGEALQTIGLFLQRGADIGVENSKGRTAFHIALAERKGRIFFVF